MRMRNSFLSIGLVGLLAACHTNSDSEKQQEGQTDLNNNKEITEGDKYRYNLNESDKMLHNLQKSPSVDTLDTDTL